jgi:hypothetical protein
MYVNNEESYYLKSLCEMQYNLWLNNQQIFKKLFEEGLQIQKQRLRDLRNYAKEKRNEEKRQHQNELDSMENHYKDQVGLMPSTCQLGLGHGWLLCNQHSFAAVIVSKANLRQYLKQYPVYVVLFPFWFKMEYKNNCIVMEYLSFLPHSFHC